MLKNYIKIAFRNLRRQKGYSFINVLGLSVGLACCLLVFIYIKHEISYDDFHAQKDRIYRVAKNRVTGGREFKSAWSQVPMGPAIELQYPGVRRAIRFWQAFQPVVGFENHYFNENEKLYFADPGVFSTFSFQLLKGDPTSVLSHPNSVVLSETAARKYFGSVDAVGKVLHYRGYPGGERDLTVKGIMKDLPSNTHFDFELLVSLNGVTREQENWGSHKPIWTYLYLNDQTDPDLLEKQLPEFLASHYDQGNDKISAVLEPVIDIHLYSDYRGGFKAGSSITYIYLLGVVGLFLLIIACINFVNLATARSFNRATEVGIRKSFGAQRSSLIRQFMGEALLIVIIAMLTAVVLAEMSLPLIQSLTGKMLAIEIFGDPVLLLTITGLTLVAGLGAGLYPAFYLSRFNTVNVLRKQMLSTAEGPSLRKFLVIFQFSVSILLIMATLVANKQMDYILGKELGFNEDQVVVLPYTENEEPFLDKLKQHPDILNATVTQRVPVNTINTDGRPVQLPENPDRVIRVESFIVDDRFLETFDIDIIAGRNLSESFASDSGAFLVNETAIKSFGWSDPAEAVGKRMTWSGSKEGRIVGVVNDFHIKSMHEHIQPTVLQLMPESTWWRTFVAVKFNTADVPGLLSFLESTWKELTPNGAYSYFFMDESLEQLHREDMKLANLFEYVSGLAIFIACLGLLGLVSFMVVQRKKEVAVRKVLGASVSSILLLFNKDYLKLILSGLVIAVPVAWYGMNLWLNNFAYRVQIGAGVIVMSGIIITVISVLIVSTQSFRAAVSNPVDSLRNE